MFSYSQDNSSLRRLLSGRLFSNASTLSVGTINTALPEYSLVDPNNLQERPATPTFQLLPSEDVSDATTISDVDRRNGLSSGGVVNRESAARFSLIKWRPDSDSAAHLEPHEFHYSYPRKSNDPWATLHLRTWDAVPGNLYPSHIQPKVPRIWSCNPIAGTIDLDLTSLQTIHQIKISLKGKLLTSSLNEGGFQFIHNESTIWQKTFGDPRHFKTLESLPDEKFDGKLVGKYSFPFSFSFPTYVDAQNKATTLSDTNIISPLPAVAAAHGSGSTLSGPQVDPTKISSISGSHSSTDTSSPREGVRLFPSDKRRPSVSVQRTDDRSHIPSVASHVPQTFAERGIPITVIYELSAIIIHGMFKTDSRIKANISYIPATHPLPASQMRRDAYGSNGHVPGPMEDPTGWFALPKARSCGMFPDDLGQRQVAIDCTLYVAEPLSYSRGAVIPCFLELSSDDVEALRSVGIPKVPVVRLLRRLRHLNSDMYTLDHEQLGQVMTLTSNCHGILINPAGTGTLRNFQHLSVIAHEVGKASWWVPPPFTNPDARRASVKLLQGEIHLRDDLMASCSCDILHVEYFVEMMALQSRHFEPILPPADGRAERRSIASVPVEITTLHRIDEPTPAEFSEAPTSYRKRIHIGDTILNLGGQG